MMTFTEEGETQAERPRKSWSKGLTLAGADVIGANCSVGPKPMLDVISRMVRPDTPARCHAERRTPAVRRRSAPLHGERRVLRQVCAPLRQGGVRLLGGCCGTTAEHVRQMKREVAGFAPHRGSDRSAFVEVEAEVRERPLRRVEDRTALARLLVTPGTFSDVGRADPAKERASRRPDRRRASTRGRWGARGQYSGVCADLATTHPARDRSRCA